MAKENKPILRHHKGWIGYVRSWKNYCENGSYDEIKWGVGTKEPKEVVKDHMGKVTIKY